MPHANLGTRQMTGALILVMFFDKVPVWMLAFAMGCDTVMFCIYTLVHR